MKKYNLYKNERDFDIYIMKILNKYDININSLNSF